MPPFSSFASSSIGACRKTRKENAPRAARLRRCRRLFLQLQLRGEDRSREDQLLVGLPCGVFNRKKRERESSFEGIRSFFFLKALPTAFFQGLSRKERERESSRKPSKGTRHTEGEVSKESGLPAGPRPPRRAPRRGGAEGDTCFFEQDFDFPLSSFFLSLSSRRSLNTWRDIKNTLPLFFFPSSVHTSVACFPTLHSLRYVHTQPRARKRQHTNSGEPKKTTNMRAFSGEPSKRRNRSTPSRLSVALPLPRLFFTSPSSTLPRWSSIWMSAARSFWIEI